MDRRRALKQFSKEELLEELATRVADKHFRDLMTMSEMELAAEELKGETGEPPIALMLSWMKPGKPTAKACPKCGKRVPVKAQGHRPPPPGLVTAAGHSPDVESKGLLGPKGSDERPARHFQAEARLPKPLDDWLAVHPLGLPS